MISLLKFNRIKLYKLVLKDPKNKKKIITNCSKEMFDNITPILNEARYNVGYINPDIAAEQLLKERRKPINLNMVLRHADDIPLLIEYEKELRRWANHEYKGNSPIDVVNNHLYYDGSYLTDLKFLALALELVYLESLKESELDDLEINPSMAPYNDRYLASNNTKVLRIMNKHYIHPKNKLSW